MALELRGHEDAELGRDELAVLHVPAHVAAVDDRLDRGRVGGRAADAVLFHRADEARFVVVRGRARAVFLGLERDESQHVAFNQRRQTTALLFDLLVGLLIALGSVAVHAQKALAFQRAARAVEQGISVLDVDRDGVVGRLDHLGRDEALPDQLVEADLVGVEELADCIGSA